MKKQPKHLNSLGLVILLFVSLLAAACSPAETAPNLPGKGGSPAAGNLGLSTQLSSTLPPPSVRLATQPPTSTPSGLPNLAPSLTPSVDPYQVYTIAHLLDRSYGGGELQIRQSLQGDPGFDRSLFSYPSDGLAIYGFMDVPRGPGPYPVVIALHGYIDPGSYQTLDYTTDYADALARAGFLVLHPNLRGFPPSDDGDNLFRVGMAIDALNLIALVQSQGGHPGALEKANPQAIGLWGHSMGGGIAIRVLTVTKAIRAAVLYAPMSGDERQNFEAINAWSEGQRGNAELAVPVAELAGISPVNYLDRISVPVSIHHGKADTLIPPAWSLDLCSRLVDLGKDVSCYLYENEPHTFYGYGVLQFKQRVTDFFNRTLKP